MTAARQRPIPVPSAYPYLRDPAEITRRSFALIRAEADLGRFPRPLQPLAVRLAHAAGDSTILSDLAWSRGAVAAGRRRLRRARPSWSTAPWSRRASRATGCRAENSVICTLRDPATAQLAAARKTTRSAAAVELWRPHLAGAVVAIGNAPTALFRLLEILAEGAAKPALVLGFPVGFVGAAEAKAALANFGRGLNFVTLQRPPRRQRARRRGGQRSRAHRP